MLLPLLGLGCAHLRSPEAFLTSDDFTWQMGASDGFHFVEYLGFSKQGWGCGARGIAGHRSGGWRVHNGVVVLAGFTGDCVSPRLVIVRREDRVYLLPWAKELCSQLSDVDWSRAFGRATDAAAPLPRRLDFCRD